MFIFVFCLCLCLFVCVYVCWFVYIFVVHKPSKSVDVPFQFCMIIKLTVLKKRKRNCYVCIFSIHSCFFIFLILLVEFLYDFSKRRIELLRISFAKISKFLISVHLCLFFSSYMIVCFLVHLCLFSIHLCLFYFYLIQRKPKIKQRDQWLNYLAKYLQLRLPTFHSCLFVFNSFMFVFLFDLQQLWNFHDIFQWLLYSILQKHLKQTKQNKHKWI